MPGSSYNLSDAANQPPSYTPNNDGQPWPAKRQGEEEEEEEERGTWDHKAEFVLSCIGLSVGLGNVWRFPYLAYENGGAAFLIAYLVLQLLIGKPMYFMELVMGQFSGSGPTKVWQMNPGFKGVGVSMCVISLIVAIYYNIIMAYTLFYFFSSMQSTLPWTECTQEWIRDYGCVDDRYPNCTLSKVYTPADNCTCTGNPDIDTNLTLTCTPPVADSNTPAQIFFTHEVTQKSDGVSPDEMGDPLWKLVLCLLASWIVVVFCLIKGIKSSGKVVYFTATFPYIVLLVLLVRGCTLEGAYKGVEYFIIPKWEELLDVQVWVKAAGQMFFSLSVSFGGIIMFGSYNKFKNPVYYDSLLISVMDLVTSVIAGFVVFTTFGHRADELGVDVDQVAKSGYGLAFVAYPEALSNLPVSQLWCCIFFFMLFTLGLDSEFALMETVMTSIQDEIPKLRKHKSIMSIILGTACFLMALPCTTPGGDYVVTIMDHYGADFAVLVLSCIEVIAVMWIYGVMRFLKDVEYMLGSKPHGWVYWVFNWCISCPILIGVLVIYRLINYSAPKYENAESYPEFAQIVGWCLMGLALSPILIFLIIRLIMSFFQPMSIMEYMFKPTAEWGPNDGSKRYQAPLTPASMEMAAHPTKQGKGIDNPGMIHDE